MIDQNRLTLRLSLREDTLGSTTALWAMAF